MSDNNHQSNSDASCPPQFYLAEEDALRPAFPPHYATERSRTQSASIQPPLSLEVPPRGKSPLMLANGSPVDFKMKRDQAFASKSRVNTSLRHHLYFGSIPCGVIALGIFVVYCVLAVLVNIEAKGVLRVPKAQSLTLGCGYPTPYKLDSYMFKLCPEQPEPITDLNTIPGAYEQMFQKLKEVADPAVWDRATSLSFSLSPQGWHLRVIRNEVHQAVRTWRYYNGPSKFDANPHMRFASFANENLPEALNTAIKRLSLLADKLVQFPLQTSKAYMMLSATFDRLRIYPFTRDSLIHYANASVEYFDYLIQDLEQLQSLRDQAYDALSKLHIEIHTAEVNIRQEWEESCRKIQSRYDSKNAMARLFSARPSCPIQPQLVQRLQLDTLKNSLDTLDDTMRQVGDELRDGRDRWQGFVTFLDLQAITGVEDLSAAVVSLEDSIGLISILHKEFKQHLQEWAVDSTITSSRLLQEARLRIGV